MFKLAYTTPALVERMRPLAGRQLVRCVFLLSSVLALGAFILGPTAIIDSLSDAGNGKIEITWSLSKAGKNESYGSEYPDEVCVRWSLKEELNSGGNPPEECFTEGMSTQSKLTIDTGIGGDTEPMEYTVNLVAIYGTSRLYGKKHVWEDITLNASN